MIITVLSLMCFLAVGRCAEVRNASFRACRNRHISSSVVRELRVHTELECAAECLTNVLCGSSNYYKENRTCQLLSEGQQFEDCGTIGEASTETTVLKKYVPQKCIHGGVWKKSQCEGCDFGFTGTYCERHIIDCAEGRSLGYSGIHLILIQPINAQGPFIVKCDFFMGLTSIEQRGAHYRCGPVENFNRTWSDYKLGFGNVSCEYFIGLENLHLLTKQRRTHLIVFLSAKMDPAWMKYEDFVIGSEEERYFMNYDSFKTVNNLYPGGDGFFLGSVRNSPFCTPDRDCGMCARDSASGWWFNETCSEINLHVPLGQSAFLKWPKSTSDNTQREVFDSALTLYPGYE